MNLFFFFVFHHCRWFNQGDASSNMNCKANYPYRVLSHWDLFFPPNERPKRTTQDKAIDISTSTKYYIQGCNFRDLNADSGGAIYISASDKSVKVLIESSMFTKCFSTSTTISSPS